VRKAEGIPRALFWDSDASRLDLQENKQYIVDRILELGDEKAVSWLFLNYSRSDIREALRRSRNISRKSHNYWTLVLGR
jgi:hypothetical protein